MKAFDVVIAYTQMAGVGVLDTMRIAEWRPPEYCLVEHTGRVVRGTGEFTVLPSGAESTLVWAEHLDLPLGLLGGLGWRLVRPAFAAGVRRSLHRFVAYAKEYADE